MRSSRFQISLLALITTVAFISCSLIRQKSVKYPNPARWEENIKAFEANAEINPPPEGAIVCIGSSSIVGWETIERDLAPLTVIPRGFGGSMMNDVLYYSDRMIIKYNPRAVLLYVGGNDISDGIPPQLVSATFEKLAGRIRAALPETRIYVLSTKPSPSGLSTWPLRIETNELLKSVCNMDPRLHFIDVASQMFSRNGELRQDIFIDDDLHMNAKGYRIWTQTVRPILLKYESSFEPIGR